MAENDDQNQSGSVLQLQVLKVWLLLSLSKCRLPARSLCPADAAGRRDRKNGSGNEEGLVVFSHDGEEENASVKTHTLKKK